MNNRAYNKLISYLNDLAEEEEVDLELIDCYIIPSIQDSIDQYEQDNFKE